jgi:TonB family protein
MRTGLSVLFNAFVASAVYSATTSDWKEQPKPNFPVAALEKNEQGFVRLRVVLKKDGTVDHVGIVQGSNNPVLDEAAQRGVLKWKLKRAAMKPSDFTAGREVVIDFREEAAVAAVYPNGTIANFGRGDAISQTAGKVWRSAPFPAYPTEARQLHETGTVLLKVAIGKNGNVERVQVLQSSGHPILDDAAVRAVRLWKAQPKYAGRTGTFPVRFSFLH